MEIVFIVQVVIIAGSLVEVGVLGIVTTVASAALVSTIELLLVLPFGAALSALGIFAVVIHGIILKRNF